MATKASVVKGTATAGTTHNVAAYQVDDSGTTRYVQRTTIDDPDGANVTGSSAQVAPSANTSIGSVSATAVISSGPKVGWMIYNKSGGTLYFGFHSGVTSSTGIPIFNNSSYQQSGPGIFTGAVYVIADSGSGKEVRIQTW